MDDTQKKIREELAKVSDSKFAKQSDNQLSSIENRYGVVRPEHSEKLRGRKRDDQSARMSGAGNSMAGKEHPNKGKSLPHIGRPGVAKPEGHGANVSRAKKGVPIPSRQGIARPEHSETMKDPSRNKGAQTMRETMTCPHCGKTANVPNYKRWHGDNCKAKK